VLCRPFRAWGVVGTVFPGRCPGLLNCAGPSGRSMIETPRASPSRSLPNHRHPTPAPPTSQSAYVPAVSFKNLRARCRRQECPRSGCRRPVQQGVDHSWSTERAPWFSGPLCRRCMSLRSPLINPCTLPQTGMFAILVVGPFSTPKPAIGLDRPCGSCVGSVSGRWKTRRGGSAQAPRTVPSRR